MHFRLFSIRGASKTICNPTAESYLEGRCSIHRQYYLLQPGDTALFQCKAYQVNYCHYNDTSIMLDNGKSAAIKKVTRNPMQVDILPAHNVRKEMRGKGVSLLFN